MDAPSPSTAAGRGGDCARFLPMLIEVEEKAVNEITGQSLKVIIAHVIASNLIIQKHPPIAPHFSLRSNI